MEDDSLVGLVTRKDVDKAIRHGLAHAPVKGFMTRDPVTVDARRRPADAGASARTGRHRTRSRGRGRSARRHRDAQGPPARRARRRLPRPAAAALAHGVDGALPHRRSSLCCPPRPSLRSSSSDRWPTSTALRAHVVGGFVRDMLLGRRNLDMDVVVEGDGVRFAESGGRGHGRTCEGPPPLRDRGARPVAHAARRHHERAHRVLHASGRAADRRAFVAPAGPLQARLHAQRDGCVHQPGVLRRDRRPVRRAERPRTRRLARACTRCRSSKTPRACCVRRASSGATASRSIRRPRNSRVARSTWACSRRSPAPGSARRCSTSSTRTAPSSVFERLVDLGALDVLLAAGRRECRGRFGVSRPPSRPTEDSPPCYARPPRRRVVLVAALASAARQDRGRALAQALPFRARVRRAGDRGRDTRGDDARGAEEPAQDTRQPALQSARARPERDRRRDVGAGHTISRGSGSSGS